ncbi:MAG: hypothetical protein QXW94_06565, partial [Desulfurococcaceae archaeon]
MRSEVSTTYYAKFTLISRKEEAHKIFSETFSFEPNTMRGLRPGRFLMVWLPGIDEFPLSPSDYDVGKRVVKLTFKVRGAGTAALSELSVGNSVFARGPYGNGFTIPRDLHHRSDEDEPVLVAGGGVGVAPLLPLIKDLVGKGFNLYVVLGFRSAADSFFVDEVSKLVGDNFAVSTDTGELGVRGTVVDAVNSILRQRYKRFSYVYACGP